LHWLACFINIEFSKFPKFKLKIILLLARLMLMDCTQNIFKIVLMVSIFFFYGSKSRIVFCQSEILLSPVFHTRKTGVFSELSGFLGYFGLTIWKSIPFSMMKKESQKVSFCLFKVCVADRSESLELRARQQEPNGKRKDREKNTAFLCTEACVLW